MTTLFALLVGIDRYRAEPVVRRLHGCGNDIDRVCAMLRRTAGETTVDALVLRDQEATFAAVVDGLRHHLTKAGPDDTALFWFSGHGAEALAPAEVSLFEGTGMLQTLVCHDSFRDGVPDLWDKELSVLLDGVAAKAGHVAVVLDSCHSEGASRALGEPDPDAAYRVAPPGPPRDPATLLPELAGRSTGPAGPAPDHVALTACRRDELAAERLLDGEPRGLFTWSLLRALDRLGSQATYRELLSATRCEVAGQRAYRQVPMLYPDGSDLAGSRFLSGSAGGPGVRLEMTYGLDGWEVNAGLAHGLPAEPAGLRFGMPHTGFEARVRLVRPERCLVTPAGSWDPPREQQFRVVLTALPRPVVTVSGTLPGTFSSPYVRIPAAGDPTDLTVETGPHGTRINDLREGRQLDVEPDRLESALEHIARWHRIRDLRNPGSRLGEPIRLEIVPALPGEDLVGPDTPALAPGPEGDYHVAYRLGDVGWVAPEIFIRLRNTGDRRLYVTLLDLNPQYAATSELLAGEPISAGHTVAALRGRRIRVTFPGGVPVEPGRTSRDWLVLVIGERPFSADPYRLPALTGTTRTTDRDLSAATPPAIDGEDWTVQRVALVAEVIP